MGTKDPKDPLVTNATITATCQSGGPAPAGVDVWLYPRGDGGTYHGVTGAGGSVNFAAIVSDRYDIDFYESAEHGPRTYLNKSLEDPVESFSGALVHK